MSFFFLFLTLDLIISLVSVCLALEVLRNGAQLFPVHLLRASCDFTDLSQIPSAAFSPKMKGFSLFLALLSGSSSLSLVSCFPFLPFVLLLCAV